MSKSIQEIIDIIKNNGIKMIDFKMVDINGQYRHVTIPAENFSEKTLERGIGFDASNYGYAVVEKVFVAVDVPLKWYDLPSKKRVNSFVTTVDHIEELTGFDFFSGMDDTLETKLESEANYDHWPQR